MPEILPPSFTKPQIFRYRLVYTFETSDHRQFHYARLLSAIFKSCEIARGCAFGS